MTKYESIRNNVLGDTDQICYERYFVTVISLVAAIFLLALCMVHVIMGLKIAPVILASTSSFVMFGLYYFVRFRGYLYFPKLILTFFGFIMLDFTWYSKFLSNGPVLFFILIFAALVIWVWEGKALVILMVFYFINLAVLFYIDYNAEASLFSYQNLKIRSIDIFLSLSLYSILLTSLLYIIKREFLRQTEKAIKSDKLKSAFLANMSHEIRTPMTGILGFSEMLKEPNLTGDQQKEYIEIIEKSGHRLLNIINDIVDISKIESGLVSIQIDEANIKDQLDYIYTFLKPEAEGKGIQFSVLNNLPKNVIQIETDREKLYAILINLVKNAIKYTDKGFIQIGCELTNNGKATSLQFFVKDSGIGIIKHKHNEIFERFIQADISNVAANQGAGLGLSITKAYVEMLGGRIWVESEEGKGSTFYFTLPYSVKQFENIKPQNISLVDSGKAKIPKLKILIVEDDKTSELILSIRLKKFGREILKARTGKEAIEICKNNDDIDLVLMDIQLPEINGYETTKRIKQINNKIIIIAQTAFGLSGDKEKALAAGCDDYISKPIDMKLLESLILKQLKK